MKVGMINNDYRSRSNPIAFKQILRNDIPAKALKGNKYLLLVQGASGTGKNAVMDPMIDSFHKIITYTTRAIRDGEIDGIHYHFTTPAKFEEAEARGEFVESTKLFGGKCYGTKRQTIVDALDGQKPGLLIVDVDGARTIRNKLKDDPEINVVSVFFRPPSLEVLEKRLRGRDVRPTKTMEEAKAMEKSIQERLGRAEYEIGCAGESDAEIVFDTPEEGIRDMKALLNLG